MSPPKKTLAMAGKLSPKNPEFSEKVEVLFTPDQIEKVKEAAREAGLSASAFCRFTVLKALVAED